jgi:predicted O-linked N-acetylglucosamine transferase (SPINDLY family)
VFFIEPVIRAHDRNRVEVFCYSNVKEPDEATELLQSLADHWYSVAGKSDEEIVQKIKSDKIDILVDLAGHTSDNNLAVFARKPAPVQVTWLGYPNTTGLQAMDYRLTDETADPSDGRERYYSEKLIRLGKGFLCYHPVQAVLDVSSLPYKDNGYITFGSFNNLSKVRPEVIKVWAAILHAVPESQLLLKAKQFKDEQVMNNFRERFAEENITSDRLKMYDKIPSNKEHLSMYNKVDIGLDTFPYNGTTTTCEALWMGVPVITLLGESHAGRVGASLLHRVGMPEFVASSVDEYVELTKSLASDRDRLQDIRANLRSRMQNSELMNSRLFTKNLEDAYTQMWRKYCEGRQENQ